MCYIHLHISARLNYIFLFCVSRDIVSSGIYMAVYAYGLEQMTEMKPVFSIMVAGGVAGT